MKAFQQCNENHAEMWCGNSVKQQIEGWILCGKELFFLCSSNFFPSFENLPDGALENFEELNFIGRKVGQDTTFTNVKKQEGKIKEQ